MQLELEQGIKPVSRLSKIPLLKSMTFLFGAAAVVSYAYLAYCALFTDRAQLTNLLVVPLTILIPLVLGQLILSKYPTHIIGLLFLLMAWSTTLRLVATVVEIYLEAQPNLHADWFRAIASNVEQVVWIPGIFIPLVVMPFFFPDGKLLSSFWRIPVAIAVANLVWMAIAITLHPWPWPYMGVLETRVPNGIPGSEPVIETITRVLNLLMVPLVVLIPATVIVRYRRASKVGKYQLKWPLAVTVLFFLYWLVVTFSPLVQAIDANNDYVITWTMAMLFPLSVGIAILRYRLLDIDILINHALVYGILTSIVILLYIVITSVAGLLIQRQTDVTSGLIAAAVVAVLFQPLRQRLQHIVDQILYGKRDDPEAVLSQLARRIEAADTSEAILSDLLQTTAHTLKIPYVAILVSTQDGGREIYTSWGKPAAPLELVPLIFQKRSIGHLAVSPRDIHARFNRRERSLLATVAALTATTFRSVQLADELSQSRQRIVTAREEERRRIRRDLHDGLGPQLASQTLSLGAVSHLIETDPDKARYLVDALQTQSEEAMRDIRRLVYELRPPALDDLGLVGALRQSASRYRIGELDFSFDIGSLPGDLPAAVETATYRIVQEAITNVVRHAEATACTIRLTCIGEDLVVEIRDNGRGLRKDYRPGIGLQAMYERAAELNGETLVEMLPNGGTRVRTRLPLEVHGEP